MLHGLNLDLGLRAERLLPAGTLAAPDTGPAAADRPPDASARLKAAREGVSLEQIRLPAAGGTLSGVATLDAQPGYGTVGLDLRLEDARAERLLAALGAKPGLTGTVALDARLTGSGASLPAIVGSLEGEGGLRLRDGSVPGLAAADPARLTPVPFLDGAFAVARGIAESAPPGLAIQVPGAWGTVQARLDLLDWMADVTVELAAPPPDDAKSAAWRLLGPPGRLQPVRAEPEPEATPAAGPEMPPATDAVIPAGAPLP